MRITLLGWVIFSSAFAQTFALFREEIGLNDFTISSTGHGIPTIVQTVGQSVLTSDPSSSGSMTSCTVASRSTMTGKFEWRRNVCTTAKGGSHLMVAGEGNNFVTVDQIGVIRAWSGKQLLWDAPPTNVPPTQLFMVNAGARKIVCATDGTTLRMYNAVNGRNLAILHADDDVSGPKKKVWLSVFASGNELAALVGRVDDKGMTSGKQAYLVSLVITGEQTVNVGEPVSMGHSADQFLAATLKIQNVGDEKNAIALTGLDNKLISFSLSSSKTSYSSALDHPLWTSIDSVEPFDKDIIRVRGSDDRYSPAKVSVAFFNSDSGTVWKQWHGEEEASQFEGINYCPAAKLMLAFSKGSLLAFDTSTSTSPLKSLKVKDETNAKNVISSEIISCDESSVSLLVTTSSLTTMLIKLDVGDKESGTSDVVWSVEDGVGTASSALLLDATDHVVLTEEDEAEVMSKISLMSRLQGQFESAIALFQGALTHSATRDDNFGFVKLSVLLSQDVHRAWGIPTTGKNRGGINWILDLPEGAQWHSLVHGTSNSPSIVHGINGGTHSPFVLALSGQKDELTWTCVDGITGEVHATGSKPMMSPAVQIIPMFGGTGSCRQVAIVIHEDNTATILPDDTKSKNLISKQLTMSTNGFYTHVLNRESNSLEALKLTQEGDGPIIQRVGKATFSGEKIVKVTYPHRDEIVQSPAQVSGDDSILLKYLNPHLAVVITIPEENNEETTSDQVIAALMNEKKKKIGPKHQRKPAGASQQPDVAGASSPGEEEKSNLFVNVIDTVSGRVLYRVSHTNASPDGPVAALIVENWILYSFLNSKSRRTELGVLTLYEGMIDKAGLTAFSSPEQALSFSSLDRESSKPVVLSKTYALIKPVTALGVTSTRAGISTRQILIASGDDRISSVSRNLLEPRRPTGEVKKHEKEEGLFQYTPLVPLVSMSAPSYNLTVSGVKHVISTPTALESQSLVLAFGGPDIFFARMSPSKGFDLLPESFNRALLSAVVVGLAVVVFVVNSMSKKKVVKQGWM
mmetsp:Transcript_21984/g.32471  ORF Transcript_21984/g.32471 Transcript_21984/m.32471 type:complete len:1028 (-) Transcript_21984:53-3136(-)|eukprot:CAMPEP_0194210814 /NCGR_PEP_ID=MMETSP0156-20130528/9124_1 /TAXON_ID=33649 /ORGANISM="Thalassionema nitzschioides, Strain L26-B" /LENGTH=1027 /DNA_ID=CAMNT_0038938219 /DNA_START=66 /DNA_END=3149 /DNA_ORIENTATION=+